MNLKTCVAPQGYFIFSIHKPAFTAENLRQNEHIAVLGALENGQQVLNRRNFPLENIVEDKADWIYEVPNPFPFRGTTYIGKTWADRSAKAPHNIALPEPESTSFTTTLTRWLESDGNASDVVARIDDLFTHMPRPVCLALATTSTDSEDLVRLAHLCGQFIYAPDGTTPEGMAFRENSNGIPKPVISDMKLFEAVANNPNLPDIYKKIMVLNPGIQGNSEIVGEWISPTGKIRVFEYLRRNSYIPWGHYAANMAHDCIRYRAKDLLPEDICGMRHLYYQRTYVRLAEQLGMPLPFNGQSGTNEELEQLREKILSALQSDDSRQELAFNRTLWGWNFGFDYAASGYRLHASHQQVHQQFALLPASVPVEAHVHLDDGKSDISSYACGDLIADFIKKYRKKHGVSFFSAYEQAIRSNCRMDGDIDGPCQLVVYEDDHIILFVPKAQTSQWELQLMPKETVGNILDAHMDMRLSLDHGIWVAMRTLGAMGAKMITVIEFSSKIDRKSSEQRLLYSFLPRLPESPGAFSEAQLRWINGHYPEDFAAACRMHLP